MEQAQFRLRLLDGFSACCRGQPLPSFHSDKVRALLAYLALESQRQPVRRERLATLLWPGYLRVSALQSLRTALFGLRQMLAPLALLEVTRQDVRLVGYQPDFWCDALEAERMWAVVESGRAADPLLLDSLADLLHGEFLAGLTVPDAPEFTAWQESQRERLAQIVHRVNALRASARDAQSGLPRPTTPFFGRQQELAVLQQKLLDPEYPLLTLTGLGGAGKTRLALAAAAQARWRFPDGVWFVPLTGLAGTATSLAGDSRTDQLAAVIANALHLDVAGRLSPVQHLLARL